MWLALAVAEVLPRQRARAMRVHEPRPAFSPIDTILNGYKPFGQRWEMLVSYMTLAPKSRQLKLRAASRLLS